MEGGEFGAGKSEEAAPPVLRGSLVDLTSQGVSCCYWTVTTLLAQVPFPRFGRVGFSFFELANACIHALWHALITRALRLGHEQELKLKLANLVGCFALHAHASGASLAFNAAHILHVLGGPLIEARYVDSEWLAVSVYLVILEADV